MDFTRIIGIIGGLAVFLYGMRVMSETLQLVAGQRLRDILKKATGNRFFGVLTGLSVTTIIQSSSATTVMMVSFVNAGLLDLSQATGIIMGANIGTTVTGWLVSILGFKVKIASFAMPAIAVGFFVRFLKKPRLTLWGEVLIGFGLLFLGLSFLKDALPNMHDSPQLAALLHHYTAHSMMSTLAVIGVGTLITMVVQSSSAVMAITLTMAANGMIDFPTAAALVLGENIGTTVTALLASIGANKSALRAASIHSMFNIFGVFWVWIIFNPFISFIDLLVPGSITASEMMPNHLAMFHTTFNILNTLLMLPFAGYLSSLAVRLIPDKESKKLKPYSEQTDLLNTNNIASIPSIAISQARRATEKMLIHTMQMFEQANDVVLALAKKPKKYRKEIKHQEDLVDSLESKIHEFLSKLSQYPLSEESSYEVTMLFQIVSDVERIADHCERLVILSKRREEKELLFSEQAYQELRSIGESTNEMLDLIFYGLVRKQSDFFDDAMKIENTINDKRYEFRKTHVKRLNNGKCQVLSGLLFLDMITSYEKIGDHSINIAEALTGRR